MKKKQNKIVVGQTLWDGQLRKYEVVRAGHINFYVKRENSNVASSDKYEVNTMICVSEFGGGHKLFLSEQDAKDEMERNFLINKIAVFFRPHLWHKDLSLSDIRNIGTAIKVEGFENTLPMNYSELSERIYKFLEKYACVRPEYDSEDEKYNSPDASMMKYCADCLKKGHVPTRIFSDWGQGGYKPYSSKEGRKEHDSLVHEINKIIKLHSK